MKYWTLLAKLFLEGFKERNIGLFNKLVAFSKQVDFHKIVELLFEGELLLHLTYPPATGPLEMIFSALY